MSGLQPQLGHLYLHTYHRVTARSPHLVSPAGLWVVLSRLCGEALPPDPGSAAAAGGASAGAGRRSRHQPVVWQCRRTGSGTHLVPVHITVPSWSRPLSPRRYPPGPSPGSGTHLALVPVPILTPQSLVRLPPQQLSTSAGTKSLNLVPPR